jgi:hypothetical protein
MVIVKLNGGLGNQMFQYAAGRRLSIFHRTPLRLDVTTFDYHRLRQYGLGAFLIKEAFATPTEIAKAQKNPFEKSGSVILRLIRMCRKRRRWTVVRENYLGPYNPGILNSSKNVYLDGYWQSKKYFEGVEDVIRSEFALRNELSRESDRIAAMISGTHSVSIHVRRADYVSDPGTNQVHGICDQSYFKKCVDLIRDRVAHPHFFIFSDDISWCKENMRFDSSFIFVDREGTGKDHEHLKLMSLCQHNIIANSSFSWWAAWLNTNMEKMVISPRRWFSIREYDTSDLIPEGWVRI